MKTRNETRTHYEVLGVDPDADEQAIKKAYRKAARKLHPDMNGGKHLPEYLLVEEAYRILSDPLARRDYDAELRGEPTASTSPVDDGPVYTAPPDWEPAPDRKVRYFNPRPAPVWVTLLAVLAMLAGGYMNWLALTMDGQIQVLHPVVTLILLLLAVFFAVAVLFSKERGMFGLVLCLGGFWFVGRYLVSTPLAWGGALLLAAGGAVVFSWSAPSRQASPLRGRTTWGEPGKSQDRTAPHTGGGAFHDGTAHRATAVDLDRLTDIPGARIFHGVMLPETRVVLDHVVVAGRHVVAVMSKYVAGTRGYWSNGYLRTESGSYDPPLGDAVLQEVASLAQAGVVMGLVSLSGPDGEVWVDNTGSPEAVLAGSPNWVAHAARSFLLEAADNHHVNLGAVSDLSQTTI